MLRNCQAFQQTLFDFDSNREYINEMVSITRSQSNQAVLAMVYPLVALIGENMKTSPKFCPGAGLLSRNYVVWAGLSNENFSGTEVNPGGDGNWSN